MLDIVKLKSGKVLIISDEFICKYNSIEEFYKDDGDLTVPPFCVDLNDVLFIYEGIEIRNPYVSSCGRFEVDPIEYYGEAYLNSIKKG